MARLQRRMRGEGRCRDLDRRNLLGRAWTCRGHAMRAASSPWRKAVTRIFDAPEHSSAFARCARTGALRCGGAMLGAWRGGVFSCRPHNPRRTGAVLRLRGRVPVLELRPASGKRRAYSTCRRPAALPTSLDTEADRRTATQKPSTDPSETRNVACKKPNHRRASAACAVDRGARRGPDRRLGDELLSADHSRGRHLARHRAFAKRWSTAGVTVMLLVSALARALARPQARPRWRARHHDARLDRSWRSRSFSSAFRPG